MELTNRVRPGRSSRFANAFNLNTKSNAKQYVTVFFWTLAISLVIFIPFVIMDGGYFIYLGDFNCQQIPFYIEVNESIRNGEFFWNWNTDLGANLIGSYAFYLIGSPFFWLTLLLPLQLGWSEHSFSHLHQNGRGRDNGVRLSQTFSPKPQQRLYRRNAVCLFGVCILQYLFQSLP